MPAGGGGEGPAQEVLLDRCDRGRGERIDAGAQRGDGDGLEGRGHGSAVGAFRRRVEQEPHEAIVGVEGAALAERFRPQQRRFQVTAGERAVPGLQFVQRGPDVQEFVQTVGLAGILRG